MIRLSNASPAIGTPSVPMMSDARRPRRRTPGPTEMIVKSLVPPPKSPIRIRSSRSQARFVGVRGRDRLVLEDDLVEAGEADRRQQPLGGEGVELGVAADSRNAPAGRGRSAAAPATTRSPSRSLMCLPISAISFSSV